MLCASAVFLAVLPRLKAGEVMPPAPPKYFNDFASVTTPATQDRLNTQLEQFEKDTSSQIVVAIFPKMQTDSSIEDYANRMFRAWKIGQEKKNNGVLLAVFVQDRKMKIEVGYGLEGAIPDATAKRIISDEIAPHLRTGDFDGGLSAGVSALMQAARGEYKGTGRTAAQGRRVNPIIVPLIFFGVIALIAFMARRRPRGTLYRRGSSGWGPIIWTGGGGGWGGGGGGGGWSSGGGFSGGGGSSGGGGASGSW
jgi:uncharacterized protein